MTDPQPPGEDTEPVATAATSDTPTARQPDAPTSPSVPEEPAGSGGKTFKAWFGSAATAAVVAAVVAAIVAAVVAAAVVAVSDRGYDSSNRWPGSDPGRGRAEMPERGSSGPDRLARSRRGIFGTVTKVDGSTMTVRATKGFRSSGSNGDGEGDGEGGGEDDKDTYRVTTDASTRIVRTGSDTMTKPIAVSDIQPGDRIRVTGKTSERTIEATAIIVGDEDALDRPGGGGPMRGERRGR